MKNQRPCWALTPERQKCLADIILAAVSERAYTRDELTVTVRSDCYGMDYEFEDIGSFCDKNKSEMVAL